jgi:ubiquinone/menaquinone biosynthesis C-methylase UbiE
MADSEYDPSCAELKAYWNAKSLLPGGSHQRVEAGRRAQLMRFENFVRLHRLDGATVLDIGCGQGDLWGHLKARKINCDYEGVDISEEMIASCRRVYPEARFNVRDVLNEPPPPKSVDYVVAFAVHNVIVPRGREILESLTRLQFETCRIAAHIDVLSDRYRQFASHIQAWQAESVLAFAFSLTPYVALHHHYLPHDFSCTLFREPIIDTDSELLLDWPMERR